jgi:hypothetical protein
MDRVRARDEPGTSALLKRGSPTCHTPAPDPCRVSLLLVPSLA